MIIRKAVVEDIKEISKIESREFPLDSYNHSQIESVVLSDRQLAFVMEFNKNILGYVLIDLMYGEANILKIAVVEKGKGLGKLLLKYTVDALKKLNVQKLFIEVSDKNIIAINLYKSFDFHITRVRKSYYKDGSHAIEMLKVL